MIADNDFACKQWLHERTLCETIARIAAGVLLAVVLWLFAGCGKVDQLEAHYTGWSRICIGGVQYYQFTSGAAPAYTPDGKLVACK